MAGIELINQKVREQSAFIPTLKAEIEKVIVGQEYMIDRLIISMLANGHVLLEGVPGLAIAADDLHALERFGVGEGIGVRLVWVNRRLILERCSASNASSASRSAAWSRPLEPSSSAPGSPATRFVPMSQPQSLLRKTYAEPAEDPASSSPGAPATTVVPLMATPKPIRAPWVKCSTVL
mgnify:CR=1 FL=1